MTDLNDSLDALFTGDTGPVRAATRATVEYCTAEERFTEDCQKCRGRGRFISYAGRDCGPCFACKGARRVSYKTSPEARAQNRATSAARKARSEDESLEAFAAQFPTEAAWMRSASERGFNFATQMLDAVRRFGDLTENQMAAIRRMVEKDAARVAERAERVARAPAADTAGVDRLKAAFDRAIAATAAKQTDTGMPLRLRSPRITIGGVTISPAKATSKNPGALYVKRGQDYLGKIADGRFFASRECSAETEAQVLKFVADPAEAAKAYGQETGICCVCNAELKSEWRLRGIGPVCAKKYGW